MAHLTNTNGHAQLTNTNTSAHTSTTILKTLQQKPVMQSNTHLSYNTAENYKVLLKTTIHGETQKDKIQKM